MSLSLNKLQKPHYLPPHNVSSGQIQVQTRFWNWKGYSFRYQYFETNGPTLVLIHKFGVNSDHLRKDTPVLIKSHRVYSIDLIGYGYSDKPKPTDFIDELFYTFKTWSSQLNDFSQRVVNDRAFFICNSSGGLVGLQAAVKKPSVYVKVCSDGA